jgi:predicted TPR repeat methyltransferase
MVDKSSMRSAAFAAAVDHFQLGRLAEAESACRDVLAIEPDHIDSLNLLGFIAFKSGRYMDAVEALSAAVARDAGNAQCLYNRGLAWVRIGRLEAAADDFERAVAIRPDFFAARVSLGNALKALGKLHEATAQYRTALEANPSYALAHLNLGRTLRDKGELVDAKAHFERALAIEPQSASAWSGLAGTLAELGSIESALASYERALALDPNDAGTHNNLGALLWRENRSQEAAWHYRRALALDPGLVLAHNNLGIDLRKQGSLAEALACFEQALTIDPVNVDAQVNICAAVYELSLSDHDAARRHAQQLLQDHGDRPLMRRGLAGLLGIKPDHAHDQDYSRAVFDRFAGVFDRTLSDLRYADLLAALMTALRIAPDVGPTFDVLDAGCGTGLCGQQLRPIARTLSGVDLSPKMLARAKSLSIYDQMICDDAVKFMSTSRGTFDLVVSSDVITYIGDLAQFAAGVFHALRMKGRCAITAESLDESGVDYWLAPSGRYQHSRDYLERVFNGVGLDVAITRSVLRFEAARPTPALILTGEKP